MDIGYFLFPSMLLDLTEDTVYKPCLVFFFFFYLKLYSQVISPCSHPQNLTVRLTSYKHVRTATFFFQFCYLLHPFEQYFVHNSLGNATVKRVN